MLACRHRLVEIGRDPPPLVHAVLYMAGQIREECAVLRAPPVCGAVEIVSCERLVLATLKAGELFGEMASILGERERTARAVTATNAVIDVIDSTTMQRKLGEADPVLRALVRNLTIRLADANKMNEERWLLLNVYQSLAPDEIERP